MALFTKNKALYQQALIDAKVGLLNWNRTTNGASSKLPFGGLGKSGNDRPSAHYAIQYCTTRSPAWKISQVMMKLKICRD